MKYICTSFKKLRIDDEIILTIGNFDGIHKGHGDILSRIKKEAENLNLKAAILSFNPHPKIYFNDEKNFLINSKSKKFSTLKRMGIDYLIELDFDEDLINLSFNDFEQSILIEKLNIKKLYLGKDFRYGNQRKGNIQTIKNLCIEANIFFEEVGLINNTTSNSKVSSSQIRQFIKDGDIHLANEVLVYNFSVSNTVVKGDQRGRTIGIPTANIEYPKDLIAPPYGVYAVEVKILEKIYSGIANFGMRPTFNKNSPILEAHIFDFDEDIYGDEIEVIFHSKIRDEKKFDGIKELLNQISLDITVAKQKLQYGN